MKSKQAPSSSTLKPTTTIMASWVVWLELQLRGDSAVAVAEHLKSTFEWPYLMSTNKTGFRNVLLNTRNCWRLQFLSTSGLTPPICLVYLVSCHFWHHLRVSPTKTPSSYYSPLHISRVPISSPRPVVVLPFNRPSSSDALSFSPLRHISTSSTSSSSNS